MLKDVICPNCQKDEYRIVRVNGVNVKQCRGCGAYYQLAEKEIITKRIEKYLPDCKNEQGNFIKCPKCGCTDFIKISELGLGERILLDFRFLIEKRSLNSSEEDAYYLCRNPICRYVWWKDLDCQEETP